MKRLALIVVAAAGLSGMGISQATPVEFNLSLSGLNENPIVNTPGGGHATITIDTATGLLTVDAVFGGLTAGTSASHIHCCSAPGTNAGVATTTPTFAGFPLGVTSGTFHTVLDMSLASSYNPAFITANGGSVTTAEAVLFAGILAGQSYLNIHTTSNPGGEIRGQIVPEPATLLLLAGGLFAAGLSRRRTP